MANIASNGSILLFQTLNDNLLHHKFSFCTNLFSTPSSLSILAGSGFCLKYMGAMVALGNLIVVKISATAGGRDLHYDEVACSGIESDEDNLNLSDVVEIPFTPGY